MKRSHRIFSPLLTVAFCLILSQTQFIPWLSDTTLDIFFKIRGPLQPNQSIVIVGIDEHSLNEIGPWPFPREIHAQLLTKLHLAKAIGFDLLFTHSTDGDVEFIKAIEKSPPVSMAVARNYQGALLLPPKPLQDAGNLGHIETLLGEDGVVRRVDLVKWGMSVISKAMVSSQADFSDGKPLDEQSRVINFYGPEFTFLYVPYADVLNDQFPAEFFQNKYVLVGSEALALGDVHITPFSRKHPVPGVEVQATILNNLLNDSFIVELKAGSYGFSLFFLVMGAMFWPGGRETRNMLLGVGGVFALGGVAITLFRYNYYLNPSLPIFVLLLCYLGHLISQWLWLTTKLVKQIRQLDKQLDEGLDKVFTTIPTSLVRKYNTPEKRKLSGGIDRHISRIHHGIEALALQNSFINHLLSKETPPLILWQQDSGAIVLANTGFVELWKNMSDINSPLPNLSEFYTLLVSKVVTDKKISQKTAFDKDLQLDRMVDVGLLVNGRKSYNRVLIHEVKGSILGFSGVLASFTDVTEIRELERIKGEVMNIVSHELKLPLTTIMGFAEMLSENLKGESKVFAEEIRSQSKRLAKMIEDFLDIARIESGKYVINKYPFDLLSVVHDAASGVHHIAERKGVEIVYTLPAKITHLMGDEVLIIQAILNLLDNAVKFTPAHSKVFVEVSESETDIVLQVADEGPGIDGKEKKLIFEKFVRGGGQKNESGFGLGLSFVRQVVEGHGGTISVEDVEGGGARFIMIFPKQQ